MYVTHQRRYVAVSAKTADVILTGWSLSVIVLSVNFHPCHFVRHFPICQFPVLQFQSNPQVFDVKDMMCALQWEHRILINCIKLTIVNFI